MVWYRFEEKKGSENSQHEEVSSYFGDVQFISSEERVPSSSEGLESTLLLFPRKRYPRKHFTPFTQPNLNTIQPSLSFHLRDGVGRVVKINKPRVTLLRSFTLYITNPFSPVQPSFLLLGKVEYTHQHDNTNTIFLLSNDPVAIQPSPLLIHFPFPKQK